MDRLAGGRERLEVTIFGGLLKVVLGAGFTKVISDLIQQPVVLSPATVLLGLTFSVVVGIFFGFSAPSGPGRWTTTR